MTDDPLAHLRARFRKRAQDDAAALRQAWRAGAQGLAQVEQLAHSLAGAAGIFGYSEIGGAAVAVDARFAQGQTPDDDEIAALLAAIDGL